MAKHRRKSHDSNERNNTINNNGNMNMPQNPFGIDPFQLMSLLGGNIDINSIGNILSSMNTNGFNIGNLEQIANMAGINLNNMNNNGFKGMVNSNEPQNDSMEVNNKEEIQNIDVDMKVQKRENDKKRNNKRQEKISTDDENLIFLKQLQTYIHPEKREFIDRIIKVYCEGKI